MRSLSKVTHQFFKKIKYVVFIYSVSGSVNFLHASCLESVAHKYQLMPSILLAIAIAESGGNPGVLSSLNVNGTRDIGLMQINSSWLPRLAAIGIRPEDLLNPCVSLDVAAWILSQNISQYGSTWRAVGAYNSGKIRAQLIYANKVSEIFENIEKNKHGQ